MSWKKHFRVVNTTTTSLSPQPQVLNLSTEQQGGPVGSSAKYASYLPELYSGHPNRIQRYYQYDDMDRDSDINAALDTIADFCTQSEEQNDQPFDIQYNGEPNETEVKLITDYLTKWTRTNEFKAKTWDIVRNTIKFGDQFFLRDPETGKWDWLDQYAVELVKVKDEEGGREPDEYIIRGLDDVRKERYDAKTMDPTQYRTPMGTPIATARPIGGTGGVGGGMFQLPGQNKDPRQQRFGQGAYQDLTVVDASHVVHLSLSAGMDINWPFGQSVLESIFKTYKQKELLEDAIIIYRVQRAPERRIFYIDTGAMPPPRARAHVEAIKNEIHQRRIPNRTGGGNSIMDAAYNPLSILDDYFFAQSSEGRGSRVETLPGGDSLGETGDLDFFSKKLARGLRIPPSYLALGDEGANVSYNDGKLGAAMIQEYRFNKYCMRIQSRLAPVFEAEFKKYLADNGIEIENSLFELKFNPPQNFTKYRQIELDVAQVNVYQMVADNKKLSERFKLQRFLNLSEDEIIENERLWKEENAHRLKKVVGSTPAEMNPEGDLNAVGVSVPSDLEIPDDMALEQGTDELGDEMPADETMPTGGQGQTGGASPPQGGPQGGPPAAGGPPGGTL